MPMTDLAAPLARFWQRRVQTQLDSVPHPRDAERQLVPGPDADRVLVLGNGAAIGFGVRSQELALPGALARGLAAATGRGAAVDVMAKRGTTIAAIGDLMAGTRMQRYDAIVLTVGATDAYGLLPIERWREQVARTLDLVRAAVAPTAEVLMLAATPLQHAGSMHGPFDRTADGHAERMDAASEQVCATAGAVFVRVPTALLRSAPRTSEGYTALADVLVPHLAPRLDALARDTPPDSARAFRTTADPEAPRQAALESSGVLQLPSDERLERLVRSARDLFGTSGAALTLIDGDRQVHHTSVGLDGDSIARADSVCSRTITGDGVLVLDDLDAPGGLAAGMRSHGQQVRFYAGHPIESPDGFRIGALCVFDGAPRSASPLEAEGLADLANRLQNTLWAQSSRRHDAQEEPPGADQAPRATQRPATAS